MPAVETKMLEQKVIPMFECKMSTDGNGTIEGYASVKHDIDAYGDRILDGAYADLEEFKASGWSGFNHEDLIGMIVEAREDAKGLFVKIAFHSDDESQAVRTKLAERMAAGKTIGMSIMYRTLDAAWVTENGEDIRDLKKIQVKEAGPVLLPAAANATVTGIKSDAGFTFDEKVGRLLDDADDLTGRLETFRKDRSQGLSEKNVERAKSLLERLSALVEEPKSAEPVDPKVIESLQPTW